MKKTSTQKNFSENRELSARMLAVQATYQVLQSGARIPDIIREYLDNRIEMELDEGKMVRPDGSLFKSILTHLYDRMAEIDEIMKGHMQAKNIVPEAEVVQKEPEPLLRAVLYCGIAEILCHGDVDKALIINDYVDVCHTFYEKGQTGLVNGVLDAVASTLRVG